MVKLGVFQNQEPFAASTSAKTKSTPLSNLIHPILPETGKLKAIKHISSNNQEDCLGDFSAQFVIPTNCQRLPLHPRHKPM